MTRFAEWRPGEPGCVRQQRHRQPEFGTGGCLHPIAGQTHLPVVEVDDFTLDVTLHLSDGLFVLSSFAVTALETAQPAAFDAASGRLDIPYVEVLGSPEVYSAELELVDPALFTFALSSVMELD